MAPPEENTTENNSGLKAGLTHGRTGANSVRAVRDRLQQLQLQLQALAAEPSSLANRQGDAPVLKDDVLGVLLEEFVGFRPPLSNAHGAAPGLKEELTHSLTEVYLGLDCAYRCFQSFLKLAAKHAVGGRIAAAFPAFCRTPDDRLYDELLRLRLPAPPTTKAHAIARFQAALHCVCLIAQHLLGCCVADIQQIDDLPADAKPPQASSGSIDKACASLDCACTVADLAVTHTELAVTFLADLVDPEGWTLRMCHPRPRRTDSSNSSN